jgi:hypothetical protein
VVHEMQEKGKKTIKTTTAPSFTTPMFCSIPRTRSAFSVPQTKVLSESVGRGGGKWATRRELRRKADPGSFKHPPFVLQVLFSSTCTECGSPPFTFEVGSAACALTVGWQQQVWRPMSCSGSSSTRTHWMSHMTLARMDECPAVTWCR